MDHLLGIGTGGYVWGATLPVLFLIFLPLIALWTVFWKGLALWHSAQRAERWWFVALLFVNTLGILEIVYLFFIAKLTFSTLFSSRITKI